MYNRYVRLHLMQLNWNGMEWNGIETRTYSN